MLKILGFTGEIPRLTPRLLPDTAAQVAVNTRLDGGAINPLRAPSPVHTLGADARTIFKHGATWYGFNAVVDVVPGPVAADRLYYSGLGEPKMVSGGTTYVLAIQSPSAALVASLASGTPDPATQQSILYVYTLVTSFGEETAPAPASNTILWSAGCTVRLTGFQVGQADRGITKQRIYRSQTSASGTTDLFLIAERNVSTGEFIDNPVVNTLQELLPSTDYAPPPPGLTGLISLPNGMLAGFEGKKLYFCEPYRPHAWPEKYVLTTDYQIVGLGAYGSSVAVLTAGNPYVAQGTAPENMTLERIEVAYPCLTREGIADMGYFVAYPSPEGLVTIGPNGAQLATRNLMTREQWDELKPLTFRAAHVEGRYVATYETATASRETVIIDLSGDQPFRVRSDLALTALWHDPAGGRLYVLQGLRNIAEWDGLDADPMEQIWRSKPFHLPRPVNFGALKAEGALEGGLGTTIRVYADGRLVSTVQGLNTVHRLPSGFLADRWELEARGRAEITGLFLAISPQEINA